MKPMKSIIKKSSLFILLTVGFFNVNAQVGIGVAAPNANSILDLTNTNDKGLLLPKLSVVPAAGAGTEGMLYYFNSNLYLRDTAGFNAITPWQYLYNASSIKAAVFNPPSYIGVGIGLTPGKVLASMHIALNSKQVSKTGTSASLLIGDSASTDHMLFDNDEIMVKSDASTGGLMKLQREDGSLTIGSDRAEPVDSLVSYLNTTVGSTTNKKNLNVNGKVKELGNDLVPSGVIVMWSGTTAPDGWKLCDGTSYTTDAGSTILAPNLKGKFIVGLDNTTPTPDADYDAIGDNGGSKTSTLVLANIPNHTHGGTTTTTGSSHSHSQTRYLADNDDNDDTHYSYGTSGGGDPQGASSAANISSSGSTHTHTFTTSTCSGCSATAFASRPPYYTLAYIIKK